MLYLNKMLRYALIALFIALPGSVFAAAGQAIFVLGKAHVETENGEQQRLRKGSEVQSKDTIVTSKRGQVQLRMSDGSLTAVRPNSRFVIENFKYEENSETDKSMYNLVKGGFRSITGKIGKENKSAYGVKTVVGTIGIRGTDFSARLCEADCNGADGGLYVSVMQGGVILSNDGGEVDIDPGEYGFMQDQDTQPMYLEDAPSNLLFANTDAASTEEQEAAQESSIGGENTEVASLSEEPTIADAPIFEVPTTETEPEFIPALPIIGSASYILASGSLSDGINTGSLSSVNLTVDFASTVVNSDLSGTLGTQNWTATGSGNLNNDGSLSGSFNQVGSNMTDNNDLFNSPFTANGSFDGQLALQNDASNPSTATYSYDLTANTTTISGDAQLNLAP